MDKKGHEYTVDECREIFLEILESHMEFIIHEDRRPTAREKLDLMIFTFLGILDGNTIGLPAFEVRPIPHESDKEYSQRQGESWWPSGIDIFDGEMHSRWANRKL